MLPVEADDSVDPLRWYGVDIEGGTLTVLPESVGKYLSLLLEKLGEGECDSRVGEARRANRVEVEIIGS